MRTIDFEPILGFLEEHLARVRPLAKRHELAWWDFATTGSEAAARERETAEVELRRVYADEAGYARVRGMLWSIEHDCDPGAVDPVLGRRVYLVFLAYLEGQRDEALLKEIARRETAIEGTFHNYRARLGGREATENDIRRILTEETDLSLRREAWEASKGIGAVVAGEILDLVDLRNRVARKLGFDDYFSLALEVSEIDMAKLFGLLGEVAEKTEGPYRAVKADLDAGLARRFGVPAGELRPWHYSDPFFQEAPSDGTLDLDEPYRGRDPAALARRFYEGLGMDVEPILAASDLTPRPGKCQHAFCLAIDRGRDVRVLSNNEPSAYWAGTMLHELGHAVYDWHLDPELPYELRAPAHSITTEAVAMLLGRHDLDPYFLAEVAGMDRDRVSERAPALREKSRAAALVFIRWALVVVRFERELYRDPRQDLTRFWWDLVERLQEIRRPEGRAEPDWATKIHIATTPVYYQNYILGELFACQLDEAIRDATGAKTLVGERAAGDFLIERVFRPGARWRWEELIRRATGAPLGVGAFLKHIRA